MRAAIEARLGPAPEPAQREEVERVARAKLEAARRGLRGLDLVVTVAPLMGLLGTVLGMIEAFQALEAAGARADPSTLAGGIWVALLTTAMGMGLAIPAGVALAGFEGVIDRRGGRHGRPRDPGVSRHAAAHLGAGRRMRLARRKPRAGARTSRPWSTSCSFCSSSSLLAARFGADEELALAPRRGHRELERAAAPSSASAPAASRSTGSISMRGPARSARPAGDGACRAGADRPPPRGRARVMSSP